MSTAGHGPRCAWDYDSQSGFCCCGLVPPVLGAEQAPVAAWAPSFATLKIGGVEYPMSSVSYSRTEEPIGDVDVRPHLSGKSELVASFGLIKSEFEALSAFFAPLERPRIKLTGTNRDGSTFTEEVDAADVRVVFERRGLPRPGQWSDRARKRRARRLERARERRFGLSRRGLRYGFPYEPPRALSAIHAECRAAMEEADRPMVEAAYQQLMPEGVTLTFPGPGMAVQDGLILGINIAPTLDQDIQDAILGKGGGHV